MTHWELEKKIAATLVLALLGVSYLAGAAKVFVSVGVTPSQIEKRYGPDIKDDKQSDDLESFLEEPPGAISFEKLVHLSHAHLMPYTFLLALLSFFVLSLRWSPRSKILFLTVFTLSILGDFIFMFLTRFVAPVFKFGLAASGSLFGLCVGTAILASLYEIWIIGEKK